MARQEKLEKVPEAKLQQVVADYKRAGATKVESEKDGPGTYTVTATFP